MLSEWLVSETGRQFSLAWLSLDEDDNDPARFLTYLVSAFSNIDCFGSDEVLSLLQSPQPPPRKVILTGADQPFGDDPDSTSRLSLTITI